MYRDEVLINRLKMGHTLLTHGYLMNDVPDVAPHCKLCNSAILNIKHIMLECKQFRDTRQDCLKMCRCNRAPNMRDLLGRNMKFFEFLLLLLKKIGNARPGEGDCHPISPKTPAPHYQPVEEKKRKGK